MKAAEFLVRLVSLVVVTAAFFGIPFCWVGVKVQGLVWGLLLTLLMGRFFCRAICPLGIWQSLVNAVFHPKSHVRRVCTRLPETKMQRVVRWGIVAAFVILAVAGFMGLATCLNPISIYGKAVSAFRAVVEAPEGQPIWVTTETRLFALCSVTGFALVTVLAGLGKGRVWCNWICPFGTLYTLLARVSLRKDRVVGRCAACRRCFAVAGESSEKVESAANGQPACNRREAVTGLVLLAVSDKLTDGGCADVSLPGVPNRETPVLPPGAHGRRKFSLMCASCQLCVANCPGGCLKPSTRLSTFGQPEMDFRQGACIATCVRCGEICPEGAIRKLQDIQRPHVHMGRAVWKRDLCLRQTEKMTCTACQRKCPVQAIHLVAGFPVVDEAVCIGCGACEHVCPARPMPAIFVEGYEEPRIIRPVTALEGCLTARSDLKKVQEQGEKK